MGADSFTITTTTTLPGGEKMPVFGLGTWRSDKGKVQAAVTEALRLGYRHIDAAQIYQNQEEVGAGIKDAVTRGYIKDVGEVWLTSKVWNTDHRRVRPAAEKILRELGVSKLTHLLIHWPTSWINRGEDELWPKDDEGRFMVDTDVDLKDVWREMEKLVQDGLVESIGLSNFNQQEVQYLLDNCRIKPSSCQVECHPYFPQDRLRDFLHSHGIALVAYCPLGNLDPSDPNRPCVLRDEVITRMAAKYHKSPAQICIRWGLQKGNVVIPKSINPARLEENAHIFEFTISDEDMAEISKLGSGSNARRLSNPPFRVNGTPAFPDSPPTVPLSHMKDNKA